MINLVFSVIIDTFMKIKAVEEERIAIELDELEY